MIWLQAHATLILTIWGCVWALATALQSAFPAGSTAWKICHAVLALSPLDFVKAMKSLGASLVPPMAMLCLVLAAVGACTPPAKAPATDPRALARASVSLLEDAWMASAQGCLDLAEATDSDAVRAKCEPPLTASRNMLIAASDSVDLWTEADQRNFPCLVTSAAMGVEQVTGIAGIKLPQLVKDGLSMASTYAGKCAQ